ncbi:MAG: response regulator [Rhizomicrobium sp.]|jgi:DNA-binding response OmpR family regulator
MDQQHAQSAGRLRDTRILVVEDEPVLALELQFALEDEGADVVGPACNLDRAVALAEGESITAAVLDMRLGPNSVGPVARALAHRKIPFLFYSGQPLNDPIRTEWPGSHMIQKPASTASLIQAVARLVAPDG